MQTPQHIKQDKRQINRLSKPGYRAMVLCIPFLSGLAIWLAVQHSPQTGQPTTEKSPRQAYLEILGETHTGLRLARLKDFIAHTPSNIDTARAISRRDILGQYEQNAWARLTNVLYNLDKTRTDKTRALANYKTNWGVWNRQLALPGLLRAAGFSDTSKIETPPNNQADKDGHILPDYTPNQSMSKFARTSQNIALAGDPSVRTAIRPTLLPTTSIQNRPVRVKFAKRPRYPSRAFRKGISGQVTLALDINERGHVVRTTVISAHAPRYKDRFIRAARRAAMASKFHPETVAGRKVATSRYMRKYRFTP